MAFKVTPKGKTLPTKVSPRVGQMKALLRAGNKPVAQGLGSLNNSGVLGK